MHWSTAAAAPIAVLVTGMTGNGCAGQEAIERCKEASSEGSQLMILIADSRLTRDKLESALRQVCAMAVRHHVLRQHVECYPQSDVESVPALDRCLAACLESLECDEEGLCFICMTKLFRVVCKWQHAWRQCLRGISILACRTSDERIRLKEEGKLHAVNLEHCD